MKGIISFAAYIGFGALLHALVVGPTFDWSSAWTIGWLLGWPIALVVTFWAWILICVITVVAAAAIISLIEWGASHVE